jgi:hypothetical protein
MQIALCSAVWGRIPLTDVWWKNVKRMQRTFADNGVKAGIFVAGSESAHYKLCEYNKGMWVEAPNSQLGEKWNTVARAALAWGADYLFILGSDDFFDDAMIREYARQARAGVQYAAIRAMYMYEPDTDRAILFDNRNRLKPTPPDGNKSHVQIIYMGQSQQDPLKVMMGAGRLLHRSLFANREYFWEPNKSSGLDASMRRTLELPTPHVIPIETGIALDVKTAANIWPLDTLIEWYPGCELHDTKLLAGLPEWDDIRNLASNSPGEQG